MSRLFATALLAVLTVSVAQGHFPFIVPDAKGETAKVVFSDDLNPDTNVSIEKLAGTKLTLCDSGGKESALEWKKGEGCYEVKVPGSGNRVIYGITEYGVLQKADAKPFKLTYYPKAVIGIPTAKEAVVGKKLALEILAVGSPGKMKFRVVAAGKPLPECEVTVILPDSSKKAVKTDKEGETPAFDGSGRFGVHARQTEVKSGEHEGKKYEEVRSYATLVCDIEK
jgi:uncharacterized GH25 family protein